MAGSSAESSFLPDFCEIRMVFAVVLSGELLAVTITLVSVGEGSENLWLRLGLISGFIQWLGLRSAALLCVCKGWLRKLSDSVAGVTAYCLVMVVCVVLTEVAYWLIESRLILVSSADWNPTTGSLVLSGVHHGEFLLRNLCITAIVAAAMLRYLYVQHQWKRRVESEARARIQALQSRIRPHFLFNSMNTIASLTRSQPALAEQVTEDLAELFRVSLADAGVSATLEREFEICRQYLRIEAQRLGERLITHWQIEEVPGDARLPRLTLQPLVENAVYHGIEPAAEGGEISIRGQMNGDLVRISISNPLPGHRARKPRQGNRLAVANVSERLEAFFGVRASVCIEDADGFYVIHLTFPLERPS